jgi:hypothetical protein
MTVPVRTCARRVYSARRYDERIEGIVRRTAVTRCDVSSACAALRKRSMAKFTSAGASGGGRNFGGGLFDKAQ